MTTLIKAIVLWGIPALASLWTDYEIWARAQMVETEQLVPTDSILFAIENISAKNIDILNYCPDFYGNTEKDDDE